MAEVVAKKLCNSSKKPWYKIVKPRQPRDYRTITAISLGLRPRDRDSYQQYSLRSMV